MHLKRPLVGISGRLWWEMVDRILEENPADLTRDDFAATNILSCVPWNEEGGRNKYRAPTNEEAEACRPRLADTIAKHPPQAIILIGQTAKSQGPKAIDEALGKKNRPPILHVTHPAFWARQGGLESVPAMEARETINRFLLAHFTEPAPDPVCPAKKSKRKRRPVLGRPSRRR